MRQALRLNPAAAGAARRGGRGRRLCPCRYCRPGHPRHRCQRGGRDGYGSGCTPTPISVALWPRHGPRRCRQACRWPTSAPAAGRDRTVLAGANEARNGLRPPPPQGLHVLRRPGRSPRRDRGARRAERRRRGRPGDRGGLDAFEGEPQSPSCRRSARVQGSLRGAGDASHPFVEMDLDRAPFIDRDVRRRLPTRLTSGRSAGCTTASWIPAAPYCPLRYPVFGGPTPVPTANVTGIPISSAQAGSWSARPSRARECWSGGRDPGARELARFLAQSLSKIGLRARVARTAGPTAQAQVGIGERDPTLPHPAQYLEGVDAPLVQAQAQALAGKAIRGSWPGNGRPSTPRSFETGRSRHSALRRRAPCSRNGSTPRTACGYIPSSGWTGQASVSSSGQDAPSVIEMADALVHRRHSMR